MLSVLGAISGRSAAPVLPACRGGSWRPGDVERYGAPPAPTRALTMCHNCDIPTVHTAPDTHGLLYINVLYRDRVSLSERGSARIGRNQVVGGLDPDRSHLRSVVCPGPTHKGGFVMWSTQLGGVR